MEFFLLSLQASLCRQAVACDLRPDFHDELAVKVELGNSAESGILGHTFSWITQGAVRGMREGLSTDKPHEHDESGVAVKVGARGDVPGDAGAADARMAARIATQISQELGVARSKAESVIRLLDEGNTIPFLARYRKEQTGGLDEEAIRSIDERLDYLRNLETRKLEVIRLIDERGALTSEIRQVIYDKFQSLQIAQFFNFIPPKQLLLWYNRYEGNPLCLRCLRYLQHSTFWAGCLHFSCCQTSFSHGRNEFLAAFQPHVIVGFCYIENGSNHIALVIILATWNNRECCQSLQQAQDGRKPSGAPGPFVGKPIGPLLHPGWMDQKRKSARLPRPSRRPVDLCGESR
jgi:hypothetical protein